MLYVFHTIRGGKSKLFGFESVSGEILTTDFLFVIKKHELLKKIIGFSGDSEKEIGRKLWAKVVVHTCLHTEVDVLPIEKVLLFYKCRVQKKNKQHFLLLLPAIKRILLNNDGLKSYFLSQDRYPKVSVTKVIFQIIYGQFTMSNKTMFSMKTKKQVRQMLLL